MTLPLPPATSLYQTLFARPLLTRAGRPTVQEGAGSVASIVAPEVSIVFEKLPLVTVMALAKLSLAGGSAVTVNATAFDGPPPGGGLTTVTALIPPKASKEAGIAVVTCVELTKVVLGSGVPFQLTLEPELKLEPLAVSGKLAAPAAALDGVSCEMLGAAPVTVKLSALVGLACPGSKTVICATAALARSPVKTLAVHWVGGVQLIVRLLPFQRTTELAVKPFPFAVSVKPEAPACAVNG